MYVTYIDLHVCSRIITSLSHRSLCSQLTQSFSIYETCTTHLSNYNVGQCPNVMAARPNVDVALCKSSVIPFLVPRRKLWLTPAAGLPYSIGGTAANRGERKTWTYTVNIAPGKIPSGARAPENVYIMYQPRRRPNIVQNLVGLR